jgi:hypothetical protein
MYRPTPLGHLIAGIHRAAQFGYGTVGQTLNHIFTATHGGHVTSDIIAIVVLP